MITVIMESKGVSLLRFEFSKKRIVIDYSLITTKKQQQNNHITIENNQLYSYFINQLNFPINSRIVNPTPISLDFEELPDN
jgi:hypothetical protein